MSTKMCKLLLCSVALTIILRITDVVAVDDTEIVFKINWPGKSTVDFTEGQTNAQTNARTNVEPYIITTANNEKYQCLIPDTTQQESEYTEKFKGVDPMEFLQPLFNQKTCSFRLETYWTYEVCHGRYVRQYHEDRDGRTVRTQEYYLGKFDKEKQKTRQTEKYFTDEGQSSGPPIKTVDGIKMPYVEVEMLDGTVCDLNNKPRTIKLLYMCFEHGKNEILALEETSSCEYEAIVLSPLICGHPDYRARGMGENEISCSPLEGAPKKPRSLLALEAESHKFRHEKVTGVKMKKVQAIVHLDSQDGEARVRVEIHPIDVLDKHNVDETGNSMLEESIGQTVLSAAQSFLNGKNCLHGGTTWWKYEFCYGRSVVQYHVERDGTKITVDLGRFDKKKHIDWIEAHPEKRPKPLADRKQLSHFYGDGSFCDKAGKLRQTEVILKCDESPTTSPSSVALFLSEPNTCEYVLGVESPLICEILEHADKNGLLKEETSLNLDDLKSPIQRSTTKQDGDVDERIANDDE